MATITGDPVTKRDVCSCKIMSSDQTAKARPEKTTIETIPKGIVKRSLLGLLFITVMRELVKSRGMSNPSRVTSTGSDGYGYGYT
jgi:hypothetical protein